MKSKNGLRKGYTTGTCAQAATKASALMLTTGKIIDNVDVVTPSGVKLNLKVFGQKLGKNYASCRVVKNSGDDVDVTDGINIYSRVAYTKKTGVFIRGGKGIGIVTKPGLAIPVGEHAINPVPRRMITKEVSGCITENNGAEVTVSAPEGVRRAKNTFNPRLGITGGISILGTTGIVEPRSMMAYKKSLSLQLDILKGLGHKKAFLVFGYVGDNYCANVLNVEKDSIIKIGDYVGFMLSECVKKDIREVALVGYLGKMLKVANGQFNTNIKFGDARISTLIKFAEKKGASDSVIKDISEQTTAESAGEILIKNGLTEVFGEVARTAYLRMRKLTKNKLSLSCVVLSLQGNHLAEYPAQRRMKIGRNYLQFGICSNVPLGRCISIGVGKPRISLIGLIDE